MFAQRCHGWFWRSGKFTRLFTVVWTHLDLFALKVIHPSSLHLCFPGSQDSWLPARAQLMGGTSGRFHDGRKEKSEYFSLSSSGCTSRSFLTSLALAPTRQACRGSNYHNPQTAHLPVPWPRNGSDFLVLLIFTLTHCFLSLSSTCATESLNQICFLLEPSYTVGGNASWCNHYQKQHGGSSKN